MYHKLGVVGISKQYKKWHCDKDNVRNEKNLANVSRKENTQHVDGARVSPLADFIPVQFYPTTMRFDPDMCPFGMDSPRTASLTLSAIA